MVATIFADHDWAPISEGTTPSHRGGITVEWRPADGLLQAPGGPSGIQCKRLA
jgi:hypothetical protein